MSFEKPYADLKVVDLSQGVAGPYCGMLLGRHGAEVVKVEPLDGDWGRHLAPAYGDNTAFSIPANMGKRALAVDLKSADGRAIVDRLVADADVFLEGFRPGVIDRLGFSYERLSAVNPALIYVSVSGFGQVGPLKDKPAMDPVLQAFTGFMSENTGPDGIPHRTPNIVNDMATALYAQQAVAAALYSRLQGGAGRRIDVSLMEASANLQAVRLMSGYRDGPFKPPMVPNGIFQTADGWLQIVVIRDHDFVELARVLGRADWADDQRFQTAAGRVENAEDLIGQMRRIVAAQPSEHWRERLTEAGIQNEVVQGYREFVHHPQVEAAGLISWLEQPGSSEPWPVPNVPGMAGIDAASPDAIAPRIGQHTREILGELGFKLEEIEALAADGVIGV